MSKRFGQLLKEMRTVAGLSIAELALISSLPTARIEAIENGAERHITHDEVYKLSQAITSRSEQRFVMQDLWAALKADKLGKEAADDSKQAAG